jgi:hypothetical protein
MDLGFKVGFLSGLDFRNKVASQGRNQVLMGFGSAFARWFLQDWVGFLKTGSGFSDGFSG